MPSLIKTFALLGLMVVLGAAGAPSAPTTKGASNATSHETIQQQTSIERSTARDPAAQDAEHERVDRERRNLVAQESVARSTAVMVPLATWQLVLSVIGVLGLGFTLYYAHQSSEHSRRAVEVAADTGRRQLRAYVVQSEVALKHMNPGEVPVVEITFKNSGQTPALNFQAWGTTNIQRTAGPLPASPTGSHPGPGSTLGADCSVLLPLEVAEVMNTQTLHEVHANTAILNAQCVVTYEDIYGEQHTLQLNLRTFGHGNLLQTVLY